MMRPPIPPPFGEQPGDYGREPLLMCPNCRTPIYERVPYCPNCGAPLPAPLFHAPPASPLTILLKVLAAIALISVGLIAGVIGACFVLVGGSEGFDATTVAVAGGSFSVVAGCIAGMYFLFRTKRIR